MKQLVIWDWNNTLVDTLEASYQALIDVAHHYHVPPVSRDQVVQVIGTHRGYWQEHFKDCEEQAVAFYLQRYAAHGDTLRLIDGAKEALAYVKQCKTPQIILSNEWINLLQGEIKHTGLAPYFNKVVGTTDEHGKPELSFAQSALAGFTWDQLIFIGDGLSDMQMARALKAVSICVFDYVPRDIQVDYRCRDLSEVLSVLKDILICDKQ